MPWGIPVLFCWDCKLQEMVFFISTLSVRLQYLWAEGGWALVVVVLSFAFSVKEKVKALNALLLKMLVFWDFFAWCTFIWSCVQQQESIQLSCLDLDRDNQNEPFGPHHHFYFCVLCRIPYQVRFEACQQWTCSLVGVLLATALALHSEVQT